MQAVVVEVLIQLRVQVLTAVVLEVQVAAVKVVVVDPQLQPIMQLREQQIQEEEEEDQAEILRLPLLVAQAWLLFGIRRQQLLPGSNPIQLQGLTALLCLRG
jgi:hypothetical protein